MWMLLPCARHSEGICGLLPPAAGHEQIASAVAVDIADAKPVRVLSPGFWLRAGSKYPAICGCFLRHAGKPKHAASVTNQFGTAVACDVEKRGRLVVHNRVCQMLEPRPSGLVRIMARILKPKHLLAGPLVDQHVQPTIAIHIADGRHKIIRIVGRIEILGCVDLVPYLEVGAGIPERPVDCVAVAVAVNVAKARCFGMKGVCQLDFSKSHRLVIVCHCQRPGYGSGAEPHESPTQWRTHSIAMSNGSLHDFSLHLHTKY